MTVSVIPGVLHLGDPHTASVRVDDRHHPRGGGAGPEEPRVHTHLHHAIQAEVRLPNHHSGKSHVGPAPGQLFFNRVHSLDYRNFVR